MGQAERDHDLLKFFFYGLQVLDDALRGCHRDTREWRAFRDPHLRHRVVECPQVVRGPVYDEQERVESGMNNLRIARFGAHMLLKSYVITGLFYLGFTNVADAQTGAIYVNREKVEAALARGGVLVAATQVGVAGVHRDKPGALETQKGTTIIYVTDGEGVLAAAGRSQQLRKGDVLVVPAGTPQSFTSVSSISYLLVTVPVIATDAKAEVVYAANDRVAATMKKAGPLADGPNLRVSGGFRPANLADASPVAEVHANEADLFYVIEGRATQVLGGSVIDGKQTAPGQIRGARTEGGQMYQLGKGDVMWVPAGMPHWFPEIPEPLSYLLVKVFY
jgi:mannose-6-phosphate isomerase-like protein (cupin superfamily)